MVRYFEPGHTFMAADPTHSKLESFLVRQNGKMFDSADLEQTFRDTGCAVTDMTTEDFVD